MTWDVCRVCNGWCCNNISLLYVKSGRHLYPSKRKQAAEWWPFLTYNEDKRTWTCEHYKDNLCEIYEERPGFCKRFSCGKRGIITDIGVMEGHL